MSEHPRTLPGPLIAAVATVALQAAVLLVLAGLELVHFAPQRATMGVSTTLFFLWCGAALLACAWGLRRTSSWARGPVVLAQLITLGLAWNFRSGDTAPVSVALVVTALVALVGVLAPSSTAALEGHQPVQADGPG